MKKIYTVSTRLIAVLLLLGSFALTTVAQPIISTVTPNTAAPGAVVTITGLGFGATAADNTVYFGGVKATVTAGGGTSLTVTVPAGAQYASISVLNNTSLQTGMQKGLFLPKYDNSCYISPVGSTSRFSTAVNIPVNSPFSTSSQPRHGNIGDMDGDGKPDLVISTYGDPIMPTFAGLGTVNIYLNNSTVNGVLSYNTTPYVCTAANGGVNVKLADLDGDGKLDIIVAASGSGRISCIRNTSTGTGMAGLSFAARTDIYPGTGQVPEVAIADFDGDGKLDIASINSDTSRVQVYHNEMTSIPGGAFPNSFFGVAAPLTPFSSFPVGGLGPKTSSMDGSQPGSLVTADFNGDGKFDIVTSNTNDGTISVLRNTSSGSGNINFAAHSDVGVGLGSIYTEIQVAEINGDNLPDLLVGFYTGSASDGFEVFGNLGSLAFTRQSFSAGSYGYSITSGDFDGDGKVDVALSKNLTGRLKIFRNTHAIAGAGISSGSLTAGADYVIGGAGADIQGVTVGDMDLDGKPDVLVANKGLNSISIFENIATPDTTSITSSADSVCVGATRTFSSTLPCSGEAGIWTTKFGRASIDPVTGVATGVTAGIDTVIYKVTYLSDTNYVRFVLTVKALADTGNITGPSAVCTGASMTLQNLTAIGGVWTSSNLGNATIDTVGGIITVTGVTAGSTTILYTNSSLSCGSQSAHHVVTVNPTPNAGTISGAFGNCVGNAVTLTSLGGGSWVNANPSIATVSPGSTSTSITLNGAAVGSDSVLYIVNNGLCLDTATKVLGFISPSPTSPSLPIGGTTNVCVGSSVFLTNGLSGGTWTTANAAVASINASTGELFGISAAITDTTTIRYTVSYGGCGTADTFILVHVISLPVPGTISGANFVYAGYSTSLTTTGVGGNWSSTVPTVATVTNAGVVTGLALGTTIISYAVSNSCGTLADTQAITVLPVPTAPTITSVTPVVGIPLTTLVSITGTGFDASTPSNNIVFFGPVQGTVVGSGSTTLTVLLPIGANYTSVSYLNALSLFACNQSGFFLPTYDNGCYVPGSATFRPRVDLAVTSPFGTGAGAGPRHANFGDMDGDGKPDLIVCTYNSNTAGQGAVNIYRNIGSAGTIAYAAPVVCTSSNGGVNVKLADLDGDGKLDIIVAASNSGRISCIRNTTSLGVMSFSAKTDLNPGVGPSEVAIADYDRDGKLDIAVVTGSTSTIKVFRNNMTSIPSGAFPGTFFGATPTQFDSFAIGSTPAIGANPGSSGSIFAADFDNDGAIDIVVSNSIDDNVSVFRNTSSGTGNINFAAHFDIATGGTTATEVQAMEVNGDNRPEIVVGNYFSNNVTVFENTSSTPGTLGFTAHLYPVTGSPYSLGMGDIDGDNKVDIILGEFTGEKIEVLRNTHSGGSLVGTSFTAGSTYSIASGAEPQGLTVGDIDGDKKADVVIANRLGNSVSIFKNISTPLISAIAGATDSVCVTATITLHSMHCDSSVGFWSTTTGKASVVAGLTDTTGVVTGIAAGADTIVYTVVYLSDSSSVKFPISVKALADTGDITGLSAVCVNATLTLSNTVTGGVWSSSNTGVATVDAATGLVYAVAAGTTTIFYTAQSLSCGPLSSSHVVTVNPLPNAGTITASGPGVCVGTSLTLTASVSGGTWSNANPTIATLTFAGSTATITGAAVGNATISYSVSTPSCGSDTATYVVTVSSSTAANTPITGTTTLCLGDTSALANTSTGGTWTTSNVTVATVDAVTGVVHSIAAGADTVFYSAAYPCNTVDTFVVITVNPAPNAGVISGASDSVCVAGTIALTTTGVTGGAWHSRFGFASVNPATGLVTGVSTGQDSIVYVSNTVSCGSDSAVYAIFVNPVPVVTASSGAASVCAGSSTTLSATGALTYSWSPAGTLSSSTGSPVIATPTANTIYTVTGTNVHGCSATNTVAVNYNALPTVAAAAGTSPLCAGSTTTLQGTGATSYSWTPSADISATTGAIVNFTGTTTSTYTVTGTDGNGCVNTASVTVTVNPVPTVTATPGTTPICAGTSTTIGATGAATYSWSPSTDLSASTGATVTFSGTNTTTYTVTGTSAGCSSTATATITVNALPAITAASGTSSLCFGSSTTLSSTGGVSYVWSPSATLSASTGTPVNATPTTSTTYTVTGTDGNGCVNTNTVTVTVNALPTVTAAAGTSPLCAGTTTTLQGTGATSYSWTPSTDISATTGAIVNFTGTTTSTYTVTGTDGNGCVNTASVTVTVNPVPTVTATPGTTPICAGTTTTIGATGATTYSWSPSTDLSASTGATVTFSGTNTTTYTVTGTSAGCSSTATATITVNALPAIIAASGTSSLCFGSSTTLSSTGGVSYVWSPSATLSASTGTPVTATPTTSTTYTVTGTDGNGCVNTNTVTVTVNALPIVAATAGTSPLCAGSTTTLQGTGATSYSWTPSADISATTGAVVNFTGTTTSTYTVTGTDGNGCVNTASVTVTVNPVPTVTATPGTTPICAGTSTTIGATGAATYSWSPSTDLSASTGATVTFSGTNTTTYTVTGTSAGCSSIATATITVNPLPTVNATAGSFIICAGDNTTLSATGAATYSWTPGTDLSASTGTPVTFTGLTTSSYTVTGTDLNGCTATASLTISVNPQPNAGAVTGATSVCVGSSTSLANTTAAGAGTWSIANANATITSTGVVAGVVAGADTVYYSYTNTCGTAVDTFAMTVNPLPFADTITGANDSMCIGSTLALTDPVAGGVWSSVNTAIATIDASGVVFPVSAGTDTIRYIYTNICGSDTAIYPLTVIATPTVSVITGPDSVCVNSTIVLTNLTTGGVWTSADTTIAKIDSVTGTVLGIAQGVVVMHYSFTNFCGIADTTDTVYVNPLPFADTIHGGVDSVCIGTSLTLTDPAIGGIWSTSAPTVMTITSAGVATALSAGTAIISYAITNSCGTAYAVDTIVVNPTPALTSALTQIVCSGTPLNYIPAATPTGTAYSWTRAAVPNITNPANNGVGGINETLTSTDSVAINVIYIYSLTANGCSNTQNLTVTVNPLPTLTSDTAFTVCSGSPILYFARTGTDFTVFAWNRPAVAGITPTTASGSFVINETLTNVPGLVTIPVTYIFTLTANGCVNTQTVHANVEPAPPTLPQITTMSPPYLCAGTMYQNFGAGLTPLPGINYVWSSYNAQVWATGSTDQYCLVNFTNPGMSWVYLTSNVTGFTCTSRDSFAVIVSNDFSDHPDVWYFNTDFVCSPSDEGSYQWGYDDASTLDSTLLSGETNQNYYNPTPDFAGKYYWVITTRHGCMQKTYYKTPTGIKNVTNSGVTDVKIYPNPNNGNFSVNVTSDYTEQGVLTVTNILGQKVLEANMVTNRKIDLQLDKAAGIYFVNVNTPHGKFTGKVTITGNN
ncbi:hypothetical protein CJD36_020525 [Flavipsychrobacter stenotrophus]|uniref:Ig-like domain-containing protein n=1 Tax=Flavipsychrobacter stenotrophus TaxID=2077091 RepID=A0A2S7SRD5_9BACT|nr:FG-GAP-like repeat-containing protein [Flavipsychrobacter stenotrophus]PQJ09175.1 hypothetical protein CJD36_020525 [Flavipsychrobacter stenotrophus]